MVRGIAITAWLLGLCAGCQGTPAIGGRVPESSAGAVRFDFDDVALGALPAGWGIAETDGKGTPGTWRVADDGAGHRALMLAATRNTGSTFNLLLAPGEHAADVALSVRLRALAGVEDRGGGLVWRCRDGDEYAIARWNPLEENVRVYHVVGGRRTQVASADVFADPDAWHVLAVVARGGRVEVRFDGAALLAYDDGTIAHGGRVGVWTKADAATAFDDFEITGLDAR